MENNKCEQQEKAEVKTYVVEFTANDGLYNAFAIVRAFNTEEIQGILRAESNLNSYSDLKVLSIEEITYSTAPKLIVEKYNEE